MVSFRVSFADFSFQFAANTFPFLPPSSPHTTPPSRSCVLDGNSFPTLSLFSFFSLLISLATLFCSVASVWLFSFFFVFSELFFGRYQRYGCLRNGTIKYMILWLEVNWCGFFGAGRGSRCLRYFEIPGFAFHANHFLVPLFAWFRMECTPSKTL